MLDVAHGIFPHPCGGCTAGQEILFPLDTIRSREPAGLGQVENSGKRVVIEPGPYKSGSHPAVLDLAAQLLQFVKISRHCPAILLHQRFIVVDSVHGGADGQKIDPAVYRGIFQKSRTNVVCKIKAGQICQTFTCKLRVLDLRGNKDVRDIITTHLSPFIAGGAGACIGRKTKMDLRISFVCQL